MHTSRTRLVLTHLALGTGASAQTSVDLQLALMVDASGSVNQYRFELQKRGYVAAFRNPRVLAAMIGGRTQSIAVTMVQWTGPFLHVQVLPWTLIKDEASVKTVASVIEQTPRALFGGGTSISGAIDHAMSLFPQSPFKSERQVMDISGDGSKPFSTTDRSHFRRPIEAIRESRRTGSEVEIEDWQLEDSEPVPGQPDRRINRSGRCGRRRRPT